MAAATPSTPRDGRPAALHALAEARRSGSPLPMAIAHEALARACAAQGDSASAALQLAHALRWAEWIGARDQAVEWRCAWAEDAARRTEAQRAGTDHAVARSLAGQLAREAARGAAGVSDPAWEARVLLRAGDVLDRCGERDDAAALHLRAIRLLHRVAPPRATAVDTEFMPLL
jgi:hypothetical protein